MGFDVCLFARVEGLAQAAEVHDVLRSIVKTLVPENPGVRLEIAPFDASFRLQPETGWSPEVQLRAAVEHRGDYWAPIDDAERTCVAGIERALCALGARQHAWTPGPAGLAA